MASMTWQATSRNGCRTGITRTTTKTPPSQTLRDLLEGPSKRCAEVLGSSRLSVFAPVTEIGARWIAGQAAQDFAARRMSFDESPHLHNSIYSSAHNRAVRLSRPA